MDSPAAGRHVAVMSSQRPEWSLESVEPPPGVSLFDHASRLLPPNGTGPLPHGGDPLPDKAEPRPDRIEFAPGVKDAVVAREGSGQGPVAAAAALLGLLREEPSQQAVDVVVKGLAELSGPEDVDRLTTAVTQGRPPRERLAAAARWLCC